MNSNMCVDKSEESKGIYWTGWIKGNDWIIAEFQFVFSEKSRWIRD